MQHILTYVGGPYSHEDPNIVQARFAAAQTAMIAILNGQSVIVPYVPIAYTAPVEDKVKADFDWVAFDINFLQHCRAMIVLTIDGWETSKGVQQEIDYCKRHNIPIWYTSIENIVETCHKIAAYFQVTGDDV